MEKMIPSFVFEKGDIIRYDVSDVNLEALTMMHKVKEVLQPIIKQNKLSGKIEFTLLSDRLHIGYENIKPFEFTADLMKLITTTNWAHVV
jgi:hypothetical protein